MPGEQLKHAQALLKKAMRSSETAGRAEEAGQPTEAQAIRRAARVSAGEAEQAIKWAEREGSKTAETEDQTG